MLETWSVISNHLEAVLWHTGPATSNTRDLKQRWMPWKTLEPMRALTPEWVNDPYVKVENSISVTLAEAETLAAISVSLLMLTLGHFQFQRYWRKITLNGLLNIGGDYRIANCMLSAICPVRKWRPISGVFPIGTAISSWAPRCHNLPVEQAAYSEGRSCLTKGQPYRGCRNTVVNVSRIPPT